MNIFWLTALTLTLAYTLSRPQRWIVGMALGFEVVSVLPAGFVWLALVSPLIVKYCWWRIVPEPTPRFFRVITLTALLQFAVIIAAESVRMKNITSLPYQQLVASYGTAVVVVFGIILTHQLLTRQRQP